MAPIPVSSVQIVRSSRPPCRQVANSNLEGLNIELGKWCWEEATGSLFAGRVYSRDRRTAIPVLKFRERSTIVVLGR
jgi:hypothetical protein